MTPGVWHCATTGPVSWRCGLRSAPGPSPATSIGWPSGGRETDDHSRTYCERPRDMTGTTAEVRLHGRRVGELQFHQGGSEFIYDDDLSSPNHRVLGQIFEDDPRSIRRARVGLTPWFANLLPEGALRRQIVRELGGGRVGDFTLLLRVGSNLPGAVTVHADSEPEDDFPPETGQLDHPLRHSLAGVQLKYSISTDRLAVPVSGQGGWWIVKLPDQSLRDLPANEYLTMSWLAAAGFPVPAVHLLRADEVKGQCHVA
ncbi:type II toxin-antitoxin system HipA family toxin [Micromonospora sp. ALFpr18c]|nr:type II toxin-antitoxin system HipA family toxin [Micromonospora sp. ALFpr18c]